MGVDRELEEREVKGQEIPHYILLVDFIAKGEEAKTTLLESKSEVGIGRSGC